MRLYTGRGDDGTTDLLGARVGKDDPRVDVIGALDETTSAIGLGRALATTGDVREGLLTTQRDLYRIMAELAFTPEVRPASYSLAADRVDWLGEATDRLAAQVELPRAFIVPGESVAGAALDLARTVARRAERQAVALAHANGDVSPPILGYLNRLSSLLFAAARVEDAAAGGGIQLAKNR
ncbi:MAG: cob(I)yrinic acid a,c-diamide adenosyltransferase [Thermomicrobiales bacterium]